MIKNDKTKERIKKVVEFIEDGCLFLGVIVTIKTIKKIIEGE